MEVSQIEKLDASNYGVWKEDVRVLLMERNCWRITSGEEKYPTEVEPDEKSTPAERSKDLREKAKEIKDFSIRRDKAYTVQAIYRWEDSRFTFNKILEELLAEESRLKKCQKDQSFSAYYVDSPSSNQKQVPSSNKSVTIKPVTKTDEHHPRGRKSRPKGRQPQSKDEEPLHFQDNGTSLLIKPATSSTLFSLRVKRTKVRGSSTQLQVYTCAVRKTS
ncbi:hypothetical protein JTE90_010105 [Oedothorax gibbosus]|uniref:DUF4219 domain-containing protein n=1 Tax=Oedothorax gibbosus TaxID=931172 RepID=A0AAV6U490_9ARAC|nr:hypothetical protein JTE90_010105 [Oedothorax gibbosus]